MLVLSAATAGRGASGPSLVGINRSAGGSGRRRPGEGRGARAVAPAAASTSSAPAFIKELVAIAEETNRGETLTKEGRAKIDDICSRISAEGSPRPVTKEELSKTWKLVLTTEKETLFITSNAKKWKNLDTDVLQIIDLDVGKLQNLISFDNGAAFVVNSTLDLSEESGRSSFTFTDAQLCLPSKKTFGLPPFGQGWFDTVYVDDRFRLAMDSRGDVLLVENGGEPDFFNAP
mmetsp:Transcript_13168/g.33262  ORF Transcript_13168/g.33262 Transcript_13168/m.33262 type:complete len:232 (+) Transcript_13168:138-833(+)